MNVKHGRVNIHQSATVTFDEPVEVTSLTYRKAEPIRIEEVRMSWSNHGEGWEVGWVSLYYRRIKANGESYANMQDYTTNPERAEQLIPGVVEAARPTSIITITEGTAS